MPSAKKTTTEKISFTKKEINEVKEILRYSGYLLPTNDDELDRFNQIYGNTEVLYPDYLNDTDFLFKKNEGQNKKSKLSVKKAKNPKSSGKSTVPKKDYFKKIVLAAEIAYELHNEPTFGHKKFVKILYLCQEVCNMQLSTNFGKYAAGPLDPKLMYSIDAEFKKQGWFKAEKRSGGYGIKYIPLLNVDKYKHYYLNNYSEQAEQISIIIELLRKQKSAFCEAVATLYAVWKELLSEDVEVNKSLLYKRFYSWSKEKSNFEQSYLDIALAWMKDNNIVPV